MIDEKKLIELIDNEMEADMEAFKAIGSIPEYPSLYEIPNYYMIRYRVWKRVKQLIKEVSQ